MAENLQENVRLTRSRAAKAGMSIDPSEAKLPPLRRGKTNNKRVATEDPDVSDTNTSAQPIKKRVVLGDISNAHGEFASRNALPLPKASEVADQAVLAKGRGRGTYRSKATAVEALESKNSQTVSNDALDKENKSEAQQQVVQSSHLHLDLLTEGVIHSKSNKSSQQRKQESGVLKDTKSKSKSPESKLIVQKQPKKLDYIDIDVDHNDPQMCTVYAKDIYTNLRGIETRKRPVTDFMTSVQHDINPHMRSILVDWLVEVSEEYKLVPDTLYLTVSYIDRFLSANVVQRQQLQLVGVTCMLVASKYEEICAPHVEEFCYITDNTYTREEVLNMEINILNYFQYNITTPTTKTFLRRFIRAAQASCKVSPLLLEFMGNYLAELTLVEYDFLKYLPSMVAASVVFVARLTLDPASDPWNSTLQHYTGYEQSDLKECICAIHDLQLNKKGCTLTAVREKYRQHKFKCVANLLPPAVIDLSSLKEEVAV